MTSANSPNENGRLLFDGIEYCGLCRGAIDKVVEQKDD
jgi:hypothetical protein